MGMFQVLVTNKYTISFGECSLSIVIEHVVSQNVLGTVLILLIKYLTLLDFINSYPQHYHPPPPPQKKKADIRVKFCVHWVCCIFDFVNSFVWLFFLLLFKNYTVCIIIHNKITTRSHFAFYLLYYFSFCQTDLRLIRKDCNHCSYCESVYFVIPVSCHIACITHIAITAFQCYLTNTKNFFIGSCASTALVVEAIKASFD